MSQEEKKKDKIHFEWIKTDLTSTAFPHLFDAQLDAKINKDLAPPYQRSVTVGIEGICIPTKMDDKEEGKE